MPTEVAADSSRRIDVEPLRDLFQRSGCSAGDVARILGWKRKRYGDREGQMMLDQDRVLQVLGIHAYNPGHGLASQIRSTITVANALKIGDALGADPWEIGL